MIYSENAYVFTYQGFIYNDIIIFQVEGGGGSGRQPPQVVYTYDNKNAECTV